MRCVSLLLIKPYDEITTSKHEPYFDASMFLVKRCYRTNITIMSSTICSEFLYEHIDISYISSTTLNRRSLCAVM